ncbi:MULTISPECIES: phosphonatase-like hydrolase [unclassified Pedobacter]|uniref:phosphonatase-like hydrolase n=1 Tax=unclassified Pedobacter TaxID=2628915 RepID=UPI001E19C382|nr:MULTISPECIES: phosphonatase-like hydrolase [unclassified Pedobacter]CAH0130730.1 Pyrophosphatase PpaX [Pedobacter sp. Bi36]CAH0186132.1 Pyrophosphatase PpaX [Pedobacter sp. Bi126]
MYPEIKMVVFDMAGTTVNENNLVYKTLMDAINAAGFSYTLDQVLAVAAGKEKKEAIRSVLKTYEGSFDEAMVFDIYEEFISKLKLAYETEEILPQPGSIELFEKLRKEGIILVLNTGYDRVTAEAILSRLGWKTGTQFDTLITASEVSQNRPEPDMILLAMRQYGLTDGKSVVKVGDSSIDIEEGKNAGCGLNIGITTGAHTQKQLEKAKPDAVINNLMEIYAMVTKQN